MLAVIVALLLRESCKTIDFICDSIVKSIISMTQLIYSICLIMRVACSTAPFADALDFATLESQTFSKRSLCAPPRYNLA